MNTPDLVTLRALAEKATPGEWEIAPDPGGKVEFDVVCDNWFIATCHDGADGVGTKANAAYIAAAHPAAVLALLDEIAQLREALRLLITLTEGQHLGIAGAEAWRDARALLLGKPRA